MLFTPLATATCLLLTAMSLSVQAQTTSFNIAAVVQVNAPLGFINETSLTKNNMTATQMCVILGYKAWMRSVARSPTGGLVDGYVPKLYYYNVGPTTPSAAVMNQASTLLTIPTQGIPFQSQTMSASNYSFILTGAINPTILANGCRASGSCIVVSSLISTAALFTLPNGQRANDYLFSVLRQTINSMVVPADLMFNAKAKTATMLTANNSVFASEGIQKLANKNIDTQFQFGWPPLDSSGRIDINGHVDDKIPLVNSKLFSSQMEQMSKGVTDLLVIIGLSSNAAIVETYIDEVAKRRLNYKAIIVPSGPLRFIKSKNIQYAHGTDPWSFHLKGNDFDVLPSASGSSAKYIPWTKNATHSTAEQFLDDYVYLAGGNKDNYVVGGYIYGVLGAQAISCAHISFNMGANPKSGTDIASKLIRAYEPGLMGRFSFLQNSGILLTDDSAYQILPSIEAPSESDIDDNDNSFVPTAPLGVAKLKIDQVYPAPLWEERIPEIPSIVNSAYVVAGFFISFFGAFISLILIEHGASAHIRHHSLWETLEWLSSTSLALGIAMWGGMTTCTLELEFKYLSRGHDLVTYDLMWIFVSVVTCMASSFATIFFMTFFGLTRNPIDHPHNSQTTAGTHSLFANSVSTPARSIPRASTNYILKHLNDQSQFKQQESKAKRIVTPKALLSSFAGGLVLTGGFVATFVLQGKSILSSGAEIQDYHAGAIVGALCLCLPLTSAALWVMFYLRRSILRYFAPMLLSPAFIGAQVIMHQLGTAYTRSTATATASVSLASSFGTTGAATVSVGTDATLVLVLAVSICAAVYFILVIRNSYVLGLSKDAIEGERNQLLSGYRKSVKNNQILRDTIKLDKTRLEIKELALQIVQLGPLANGLAGVSSGGNANDNLKIGLYNHHLVVKYAALKMTVFPSINPHFYEKLNAENLFCDPVATAILGEKFANIQASPENYEFLIKARDYENSPEDTTERLELGLNILHTFLNKSSAKNLNIESSLASMVIRKLETFSALSARHHQQAASSGGSKFKHEVVKGGVPPKDLFQEIVREIRKLINTNEISRWYIESDVVGSAAYESYRLCQQLVSKIKPSAVVGSTLSLPGMMIAPSDSNLNLDSKRSSPIMMV